MARFELIAFHRGSTEYQIVRGGETANAAKFDTETKCYFNGHHSSILEV